MNFRKIIFFLAIPMLALCISCGDDPEVDPTCTDGIQNQGESGVDCGDPCPACTTVSCTDGIQNQGETDIDCGGPCDNCIAEGILYATIDGVAWESNLNDIISSGNLSMTFTNYPVPSNLANYTRIQIVSSALVEVGAVSNFTVNYIDSDIISQPHTTTQGDANNIFNIIKAENGKISGNFQADVKYEDANGAESVIQIRNGEFRNLDY